MKAHVRAWLLVAVVAMAVSAMAQEKAGRLYVPYSKLTDLNATQKSQIAAIEADYRDRIKKLEAEKHQKIQAVLNDSQRAALKKMEDDDKARDRERARKYSEKKKAEKAAAAEKK